MVDDQIVFGTLWATRFPLQLLNIEQRCPSKTICRHWWKSGFGQQVVVTDPWSKIKRTTDPREKRNGWKTWTSQKRLSALRINTWKGMLHLLVIWRSEVKSLQLCPTLCSPMDWSLPGSSIHGIFQTRILEWVAISFFRGASWPRDWTWFSHIAGRLYHLGHQGIPNLEKADLKPHVALLATSEVVKMKSIKKHQALARM